MIEERWRVMFYHRRSKARALVDVTVRGGAELPVAGGLLEGDAYRRAIDNAREILEMKHPTAAEPNERGLISVLAVERLTLNGQPYVGAGIIGPDGAGT